MFLQRYVTRTVAANFQVKRFALVLAMTCLWQNPHLQAANEDIQPLEDIHHIIKRHITASLPANIKTDIRIGKLDPHLRLSLCEQTLEAFYPVGSRKLGPTTIGIRCIGDKPWQIYVPVQIRAFGKAVVSKRPLTRGSFITSHDLTIATRELSRAINGYYSSVDQVAGMELRFSLAKGAIVGPKYLKPRYLVKRGDIITILAETNGLQIRVKGTALMDGFKGQSIRIKNTRSNRELQGEVIANRTVRIDL